MEETGKRTIFCGKPCKEDNLKIGKEMGRSA
jgi:hypothetical protein